MVFFLSPPTQQRLKKKKNPIRILHCSDVTCSLVSELLLTYCFSRDFHRENEDACICRHRKKTYSWEASASSRFWSLSDSFYFSFDRNGLSLWTVAEKTLSFASILMSRHTGPLSAYADIHSSVAWNWGSGSGGKRGTCLTWAFCLKSSICIRATT